jgi:hypothetical protein
MAEFIELPCRAADGATSTLVAHEPDGLAADAPA